MFLRDMNERVEEAEIFQMELRNIVAYSQAEALMCQDRALENRTRWQYDLADRNSHLQFRQSMMALLGAQLGFTPESLLRMQAFNSLRNVRPRPSGSVWLTSCAAFPTLRYTWTCVSVCVW